MDDDQLGSRANGVAKVSPVRTRLMTSERRIFNRWAFIVFAFYAAAAVVTAAMAVLGAKDAIGYLASLLVLGSFASGSMEPLRILAVLSNVAFITYASQHHLPPVLLLHSLLLPVNVFRLWQLHRFRPVWREYAKTLQRFRSGLNWL